MVSRSTILLTLKRITLTIRESHNLFRRKALEPLEVSTLKMIEYYLEKIKIWMKSRAKNESGGVWAPSTDQHLEPSKCRSELGEPTQVSIS